MRWIVLLVVLGCDRSSAPASPSTGPPPSPPTAASQEASTGDAPPPSKTVRDADGRCTPQPKEGDACGAGDSWCVLSWGEPGGFSSALWCRNGRWEHEEEVNLDG